MSGPRATALAALHEPLTVDLHGCGQVGSALLGLLREAGVTVAAVHRATGSRRLAAPGGRPVVVDATSPRLEGPAAHAWVAFLERTLIAGTPVVTCNKAPLALAWDRLAAASRAGGAPLAITGTVGGGTPVLPALRGLHATRPVRAVDATLSGTLAKVVPAVRAGASLGQAVAAARRLGYCEPDPRLDLDGTDAWAKACILHNALWPHRRPFTMADRPGPLRLSETAIRSLASPAVVARLQPGKVALALQDWAGAADGIQVRAHCEGGSVALSGAGAGPAATAAAVLADVRSVARGLAPGIH